MSKEILKELHEIKQSFTEDQKKAYSHAMMGENLFISGGPGTGKSFLTRALIKGMECVGKSILIMAPTGIAAINVHGTTIHRALGIGRGEIIKENSLSIRAKKCPLLDQADVVIIDEISMVRRDLFEFVAKCIHASEKRTGKRLQLILVGDFFQLPPVMLPESKELLERYYGAPVGRGYCFTSKEWSTFCFTTVVLTETVRQKDSEFIAALNKLRVGDMSCLAYLNTLPEEDARFPYLVSMNEQAEKINNEKVKELGKRYTCGPHVFEMESEGTVKPSDLIVPEKISLYPGARVMMVINDPAGKYQNGSCGTVAAIYKGGYIEVNFDNGRKKVRIEPYTWKVTRSVVTEGGSITQEECGSYTQIPLKLAYAITIHKSQGQTYDAVNIDPNCWEAAQLYVALSRVRTPTGVHLMKRIRPSAVIVDQSVVRFYKGLGSTDDCHQEEMEPVMALEETKEPEGNSSDGKIDNRPVMDKEEKKPRVGRPSPFTEGTKRIRVGADSADYIQEICKKQAVEGGKIRLLPDELDICISDAIEGGIDFSTITFMAVPLELEGKFRREIKNYEKKIDNRSK
ncbi:MAG: ATP-dependent RecD-like DNA helicase [Fusicatenibacter sp.]